MKSLVVILLASLFTYCGHAQITLDITELGSFKFEPENPFARKSSYTNIIDENGRPFIYSANKEFGLGIYTFADDGTITSVKDYTVDDFNALDVSTVFQQGDILYAGIGDFQSDGHNTGLAAIDVSDPQNSRIVSHWDTSSLLNGVSHIEVAGNYAYLAAMQDGLIVLDISQPDQIKYVSQAIPDPNYPAPSTDDHQGRGLYYRNDTLWLAHDRGGLRVFDVSDKAEPEEVYKYINENLNNQAAAAYNDVYIQGKYAYVAVDYCGMEILDISTFPYRSVQWYNPWGCTRALDNWNGADLHANEIAISESGNILFFSAGNSDLLALDISDPENMTPIEAFTDLNDSMGTYGMDLLGNKIVLSFLDNLFNIPFRADYGGIKLLEWDVLVYNEEHYYKPYRIEVYPNPVESELNIVSAQDVRSVKIYNAQGLLLKNIQGIGIELISTKELLPGIYMLLMDSGGNLSSKKIVKR